LVIAALEAQADALEQPDDSKRLHQARPDGERSQA
jgi:hypothetical protein